MPPQFYYETYGRFHAALSLNLLYPRSERAGLHAWRRALLARAEGVTFELVGRALRPGGRLLFLEHVRADSPALARWQDRLERPWRYLAIDCHCNRDLLAEIEDSELELEDVEQGELPKLGPLIAPMVVGCAVRPNGRR